MVLLHPPANHNYLSNYSVTVHTGLYILLLIMGRPNVLTNIVLSIIVLDAVWVFVQQGFPYQSYFQKYLGYGPDKATETFNDFNM